MPLPPEIQLVPLDFDTIRAELRRFLQSQDLLKDYNFEGSALSTLLDVLAYDAYYHGWYTNFAVNEVFLHTAQIRNSVVSAARQLGYTPRSVTSATAYINVTVDGLSPTEGFVSLDRYAPLTTTISGKTFTFYTLDAYTLPTYGQSSVTFPSVPVYEGTRIRQSIILSSSNISVNGGTTLKLTDPNIDTRTLRVYVKTDATSETTQEFTKATSAVTVTGDAPVYFLFESNDGLFELQFGDGILGRQVVSGNQVILEYLVSRGAEGNGGRLFTYTGTAIGQSSNIRVILNNPNIPSLGGASRETIESIKRTAPEIYQVQGRVVTPSDARAILLNEYNGIDSLSIWGGEDNDPPTYGTMFVALKPINADKFGTLQKEDISRNILRPKSLPTMRYEFVDPDYVYVVIDSDVRYSAAFTTQRPAEIANGVSQAIIQYGREELNRFGGFFRYSSLSKTIDDANPSIRSSATSVRLEKRLLTNGTSGVYTVNFGNPIFTLPNDPTANVVVVSSKIDTQRFAHAGLSGELWANCYLENRGAVINIYRDITEYSPQDVATEVQYLVRPNVGTLNVESGQVRLRGFFPTRITTNQFSELKIRAVPANADFEPARSQIIRIAEDTVTVRVVEDAVSRTNTVTGRTITASSFSF